MAIRLTTLGPVRVHADDSAVPDLPAQRLRFALLVYLAVERDASREAVLELFWPDADVTRRRHACRQALYELRQVLGDAWLDASGDRIRTFVEVDAHVFESAATAGRADEAVSLYTGEFLSGFTYDNGGFESWVERRRAHLGRLYRKLQRQRIASLSGAGRQDEALAAARAWVEAAPLDDEAAHALIEQLALAGQRAAALQYYDAYTRQLRTTLDVEPLDDTKSLVEAIRKGEFGAQRSTAAGASNEYSTLQPLADPAPTPIPITVSNPPLADDRPARRSKSWLAVATAAAVLLVAASTMFVRDRAPVAQVSTTGPIDIAVKPFVANSSDGSLAPLASELTSTLVQSLSNGSELLNVIAPTYVELRIAEGVSLDSLGRVLGADYMVAGTISRSQDDVHVSIVLINARDGSVVATAPVERPWSETRILVEDVTREVATFLRRHVSRHMEIERVRARTRSEDAWRLVLSAKNEHAPVPGLLAQGKYAEVDQRFALADSLLERAAGLDRRWAEPLVLRGWVLERRAFVRRNPLVGDPMLRHNLLVDALRMADRAIERDAKFAGAHALRGAILHQLALMPETPESMMQSRLSQAEVALRRATDLDQYDQDAWRRLAEILYTLERYEDAKRAARRANHIDPWSEHGRTIINRLFLTELELGDDSQAASWCDTGRGLFPTDPPYLYCLFALYAWADGIESEPKRLHDALEAYVNAGGRMQRELPNRLTAMHAAAYARAGQADSARAMLAQLESDTSDAALLWFRASAHSVLGEDARALELLKSWLDYRRTDGLRVARSRSFSRLRDNVEYRQLVGMTAPN